MGMKDKIQNAAQKLTGKAKQAGGDVTGDREMQAEGQAQQTTGSAKQAGENVKDAFKG